jgi:hypothetical protein
MVTIVIPVVLFYHGKYKKKEGNQLQVEIKIQLLREKKTTLNYLPSPKTRIDNSCKLNRFFKMI